MKKKSVIIALYASLVLIGGFIGYFLANSLISLIAGGGTALLLFICSYFIWKDSLNAYNVALTVVAFLSIFFALRFLTSFKLMPGGLMTLCSLALFIYLSPKAVFKKPMKL